MCALLFEQELPMLVMSGITTTNVLSMVNPLIQSGNGGTLLRVFWMQQYFKSCLFVTVILKLEF